MKGFAPWNYLVIWYVSQLISLLVNLFVFFLSLFVCYLVYYGHANEM